jgi:curved DNA-binding protein CbpA
MRDLFAVLGESRQPWLDLEKLEEYYRQLSLTNHPDRSSTGATEENFTVINEAWRVLKDPKLRIQHLLQLEGYDPGKDNTVPESLLPLFSCLGDFIARVTRLWQRREEKQNSLSKSLLHAEIVASQRETGALLADAQTLFEEAEESARSLNHSWQAQPEALAKVYRLFGYLTRWITQLEEWKFRLDNS